MFIGAVLRVRVKVEVCLTSAAPLLLGLLARRGEPARLRLRVAELPALLLALGPGVVGLWLYWLHWLHWRRCWWRWQGQQGQLLARRRRLRLQRLPLELALPMLAAGLMYVWGTEQMVFNDTLPTWYRHLRHQLTAAAVIAVLIGWAATMFWML